jgi:hypothetical protein
LIRCWLRHQVVISKRENVCRANHLSLIRNGSKLCCMSKPAKPEETKLGEVMQKVRASMFKHHVYFEGCRTCPELAAARHVNQ